jgi:hypothetical protein
MADDRTRALLSETRPPRQTSVLVGLVAVIAVGFFILRRPPKPDAPPVPPAAPITTMTVDHADQLASAMAELEKLPLAEGPPIEKIREALEGVGISDKGYLLPDGKPPPPLPANAPRAIRIGLVLVRYRGAQLAPLDSVTRDAALARANQLAAVAKTDFAAAVKAGDVGSALDIGAVQRGILEPGIQYVVFTLPAGAVSDVLDTPRGFWIVRRIR